MTTYYVLDGSYLFHSVQNIYTIPITHQNSISYGYNNKSQEKKERYVKSTGSLYGDNC